MNASEPRLGWFGALGRGLLVAALGTVLLVYGPNYIVTKLMSVSRSTRVGIATAWFGIWIALLAFTMRRLQARHVL